MVGKLVDETKSAFSQGRYILAVHECIFHQKVTRREGIVFKIDFEKGYDRTNWSCLFTVVRHMGFYKKWIGWVRSCMESARFSILI